VLLNHGLRVGLGLNFHSTSKIAAVVGAGSNERTIPIQWEPGQTYLLLPLMGNHKIFACYVKGAVLSLKMQSGTSN
jgi:hypothetical protein